MLKTKKYAAYRIVNETLPAWQQFLNQALKTEGLKLIMTPNPEQLVLAHRDPCFARTLQQADVLIPDGIGLVKLGGFTSRLTGVETVAYLLSNPLLQAEKILLIGGFYQTSASKPGRLQIGQKQLFYTPGYQNAFLPTISETKAIQRLIDDIKPIVILVAFGAPFQENFLVSQRELMAQRGVKLALAVGGSFDFILGNLPRAPMSWQNLGLEWLWRLYQQPHRWRRQLALGKFIYYHYRYWQKKSTMG